MRPAIVRSVALFSAFSAAIAATGTGARAATVPFNGTIRDFHGSFTSSAPFTPITNGHPHFEMFTVRPNDPFGPTRIPAGYGGLLNVQSQINAVEPGIVGETLGADGKPVWLGGSNSALFPTTKTRVNSAGDNLEVETDDNINRANFNQWYNDTANINQSQAVGITLDDPENDGVFTYTNDSFFPIDNQLFGNEGNAHNQHFTMDLHSDFTFRPGQTFSFTGDDDVWVFIDKQRVIDLGGAHHALTSTVNLDDLGLTEGNTYSFDFFFAERNTFESHFRIDTNLGLGGDPDPPTAIPLPPGVIPGIVLLATLGGAAGMKQLRRQIA